MRTCRRYPRDLRNGDVVRFRTRNDWETMTVAWVEPTSPHVRTIEGPAAAHWVRMGVSPNSKVEVVLP
jgi:hypothetical protein